MDGGVSMLVSDRLVVAEKSFENMASSHCCPLCSMHDGVEVGNCSWVRFLHAQRKLWDAAPSNCHSRACEVGR